MKVSSVAKKIYEYLVAMERAEDFDVTRYLMDRIAKVERDVDALKVRYATSADAETTAFVQPVGVLKTALERPELPST